MFQIDLHIAELNRPFRASRSVRLTNYIYYLCTWPSSTRNTHRRNKDGYLCLKRHTQINAQPQELQTKKE